MSTYWQLPTSGGGIAADVHINPPRYLLRKHGASVLDPDRAVQLPGRGEPRPTVYCKTRLLATASALEGSVFERLRAAADRHGVQIRVNDNWDPALTGILGRWEDLGIPNPTVVRIELEPLPEIAYVPPDAWTVLQTYREMASGDEGVESAVALDHLLSVASQPYGRPAYGDVTFNPTTTMSGPAASTSNSMYTTMGGGPRQPVTVVGAPPFRTAFRSERRPRVALIDTAVAGHPWLVDGVVNQSALAKMSTRSGGSAGDEFSAEVATDLAHGTFAAGLIRQACPDADLIALAIHDDGALTESDLADALGILAVQQASVMVTGRFDDRIDVLVLTCGYYHEDEERAADSAVQGLIRTLSRLGVAVIMAAGNEGTSRPMFPAAFAGPPFGLPDEPDSVPLIAVAALNTDGRSVALFSNDGPWVTAYRPGVSLVSTMPMEVVRVRPDDSPYAGTVRSTVDPDDFAAGFAAWSGTSFAASVLAGELAQSLIEARFTEVASVGDVVADIRDAVGRTTGRS